MTVFFKPNPATHIPVGDIWISPRGRNEDVYVATDGEEYVRLGSHAVHRLLKYLGKDVVKRGWASWETDGWRIDGDYVDFHTALGTATPRPRHYRNRLPREEVRKALLMLKCPFWSKHYGKTTLKGCDVCIFAEHWGDFQCGYRYFYMAPIRRIIAQDERNYVYTEKYREYGFGQIAATLHFTLEDEKAVESLVDGLHEGYDVEETEDGWVFRRYWGHSSRGHRPVKYYIRLQGTKGLIRAEEGGECDNWEDWEHLKSFIPNKRHIVLRAFAEVCAKSRGRVEPEYHGRWTAARLREFQALNASQMRESG